MDRPCVKSTQVYFIREKNKFLQIREKNVLLKEEEICGWVVEKRGGVLNVLGILMCF